MKTDDLNAAQKESLLDLAILAMYADGHLAAKEDERIHRLLTALGYASEYDQNVQYDSALRRVSPHAQNGNAARQHAVTLADAFTTAEQKRRVLELLDGLVTSDNSVALQETVFLSTVREALQR